VTVGAVAATYGTVVATYRNLLRRPAGRLW
jgi:hypothetical protein